MIYLKSIFDVQLWKCKCKQKDNFSLENYFFRKGKMVLDISSVSLLRKLLKSRILFLLSPI